MSSSNGTRFAMASLTVALMLGGCADMDSGLTLGDKAPPQAATQLADQSAPPASELEKATAYWGKQYAEKPTDLKAAVSYAKNLRAMGRKEEALIVTRQALELHSNDRELAGEYGRLALDFDQVSNAKKALEFADDPGRPDWRIISARGTVMAKEGNYKDAVPFYERALLLAPSQPSILNNLALAHAMNGEAAKAEDYLKRAEAAGGASPKVKQNLALVLSLQGKYDEAKEVAAHSATPDAAVANTEIVRKIVRLQPKTSTPVPPAAWDTTVTGSVAR